MGTASRPRHSAHPGGNDGARPGLAMLLAEGLRGKRGARRREGAALGPSLLALFGILGLRKRCGIKPVLLTRPFRWQQVFDRRLYAHACVYAFHLCRRNLEHGKWNTFQVLTALSEAAGYILSSLSAFSVSANFPNYSQAKYRMHWKLFLDHSFSGVSGIFLLNSLTFPSVIFCKSSSGLQPSLFQSFMDRHDALKAPSLSFAVLHFKLAFLCMQNSPSVIVNQNRVLNDWGGNFCFSRIMTAFQK